MPEKETDKVPVGKDLDISDKGDAKDPKEEDKKEDKKDKETKSVARAIFDLAWKFLFGKGDIDKELDAVNKALEGKGLNQDNIDKSMEGLKSYLEGLGSQQNSSSTPWSQSPGPTTTPGSLSQAPTRTPDTSIEGRAGRLPEPESLAPKDLGAPVNSLKKEQGNQSNDEETKKALKDFSEKIELLFLELIEEQKKNKEDQEIKEGKTIITGHGIDSSGREFVTKATIVSEGGKSTGSWNEGPGKIMEELFKGLSKFANEAKDALKKVAKEDNKGDTKTKGSPNAPNDARLNPGPSSSNTNNGPHEWLQKILREGTKVKEGEFADLKKTTEKNKDGGVGVGGR